MFVVNILTLIIPILLAMAFLTLVECKVLGYMQFWKGSKVVGPYGLLQPEADANKLFTKEPLRSATSPVTMFILAPILALGLALKMWIPLAMTHSHVNMNLGVLFMVSMSSLAVYSILWSQWASNSKYSLIGPL